MTKRIISLFLSIALLIGFAELFTSIEHSLFMEAKAYGSDNIDPDFVPMWPVKGTSEINGADYYNTKGAHNGLDIESSSKDIYPVADGKVIYAKYNSSYGNNVVILHEIKGKQFCSRYAHLKSMSVKKGDEVSANNKIGIMGSTGESSGIHLHLEIYKTDNGTESPSWWSGNYKTRCDILNSTLFYYINNNPSQLVNAHLGVAKNKSNLAKDISKYYRFFDICYEDIKGKNSAKFNVDKYTDYCAKYNNNRLKQIYPPVKMTVNKDKAAHRYGPYEKTGVYEQLSFGQEMTIVASIKNIYGNIWYKTDKGYWIYGERLSEKAVGKITFSTKKSSNVKSTSSKSQITTVPAPIVATVHEKTVIPGPVPRLAGHTFLGYATSENAQSPEYQIGDMIEVSPNQMNLYCVWREDTVTMKLESQKINLDVTNNSNANKTVKVSAKGYLTKYQKEVKAVSDNSNIATASVSDNNFKTGWIKNILRDTLTANVNIKAKSPGTANIIVSVYDNNNNAIVRKTITVKVDERYTVNYFDGNKKLTDYSQTKNFNKNLELSKSIPERDDEQIRFLGWSTKKGSSEVSYGPCDIYKDNSSLNLYAVWIENPHIEKPVFENEVLTIKGNGNMPSYPTGKTPWKEYKDQTKKIIISEGITSIGSNAFAGFKNVTEVVIPFGVIYIGSNAFQGISIKTVSIPTTVKKIGNSAFADCTKLIDVGFEGSYSKTKSISKSASLENVQIEIGAFAFENCSAMTNIILPDTVVEIGAGAFTACTALETVVLPDNIESIEDTTFFGCSSLTDVTIPDTVNVIGDNAFNGCSAMEEIVIPDGLDTLGDQAFAGCSAVENLVIPEGIEDYGAGIFANCSSLTTLELPDDLTMIPDAAFVGCSALETVKIPETVEVIGDGAFRNCTALSPVEIPDGVSSINNDAFNGCDNIYSMVIPASVTNIGDFAFSESGLKTIELNEGLTTVGIGAFAFCEELENISIPASVEMIEDGAFMGCSALTEVEMIESSVSIGDEVFYGCGNLTEIQLPEGITSIGENVFFDCSETLFVKCFSTSSIYNDIIDTVSNTTTIYPVTGVAMSQGSANINVGEALQLTAAVTPSTATDKSLEWSTNNPDIATVDNNGLVTALGGGTVTISAVTNDNKMVAQCEITVTVPVEGINMEYEEITAYTDDTISIIYNFVPENPTNISVCWASSNENVATVSEDGEVTVVGIGTAEIEVVTEDGGFRDVCTINAEEYINVEEIVLDKTEIVLQVGESTKLDITCLPANATDQYYSIYTIDKYNEIIDIQEDGSVLALSPGTAFVTVSIGEIETMCSVKVVPVTYTLTWNIDDLEINEKYEPGAIIPTPNAPHKDGYIFICWSPTIPDIMPAEDIIITALFEVDPSADALTIAKSNAKAAIDIAVPADASDTVKIIANKAKSEIDAASTVAAVEKAQTDGINEITEQIAKENKPPVSNININAFSGSKSINYREKVKISANATGLPTGYNLAIYEGDSVLAQSVADVSGNTGVEWTSDNLTGNATYTVKITDTFGNIQMDSSGNELCKNIEVKVKSGFFQKLIAFFKSLFGLLATIDIKP